MDCGGWRDGENCLLHCLLDFGVFVYQIVY